MVRGLDSLAAFTSKGNHPHTQLTTTYGVIWWERGERKKFLVAQRNPPQPGKTKWTTGFLRESREGTIKRSKTKGNGNRKKG